MNSKVKNTLLIAGVISIWFGTFVGVRNCIYPNQHSNSRKQECESKDGTYLPKENVCLEVGHIRLGENDSKISVVVYGADYCDVCKEATNYLTKRRIKFWYRDVSVRSAEDDMHSALDSSGLEHGFIPVIVVSSPGVSNKVFRGFVQDDVEAEITSRATFNGE